MRSLRINGIVVVELEMAEGHVEKLLETDSDPSATRNERVALAMKLLAAALLTMSHECFQIRGENRTENESRRVLPETLE